VVGSQAPRRSLRRSVALFIALAGGIIPATVVTVTHPKTALATSAYETDVTSDTPWVYYRMGEGSGTTLNDSSGHGVNGSYSSSGVSYGLTGPITNDSETAAEFDGSSGYASVPADSYLNPTSQITLEAWAYPTSNTGHEMMLINKEPSSWAAPYYQYSLSLYDNSGVGEPDEVDFRADIGGANTNLWIINTGWQYNAWNHIVGTYDGSNMRLYVNGTLVGRMAETGSITTYTTPLDIGMNNTPSPSIQPFDGYIGDVAVYSTALSSTDVAKHYRDSESEASAESTSGRYALTIIQDTPAGFWRLGEASGLYAHDATLNADTGAYSQAGVTYNDTGQLASEGNGAVGLDGANMDGVSIPDASVLDPTSDITLEAWAYPTANTGHEMMLISKGYTTHSSAPYWQYSLSLTDNAGASEPDGADFRADIGGTNHDLWAANTGWSYNAWNYIVGTYDGSNMNLYVNGKNVATTAESGSITTYETPVGLGVDDTPEGDPYKLPFDGRLADVAIYGSPLAQSQITTHYLASGNTLPPTSPLDIANITGPGRFCLPCFIHSVVVGFASLFPINTETGNFYHTFTDISIPGRSYPLAIARTYNSQNASTNGPFGYGWTYNYGISLAVTGTSPNQVATITQEDGSQVSFDQPASGNTWTPADSWMLATLTYNSGSSTWTFVRQASDTYTFNSSGQLTKMEDLNGYTTSLSYTSGDLTTITDPASRTLTLGWTGSHITSLTDSNVSGNTRTVSYSYDGSGNLQEVTDVNGGDTDFAYDGSHRMTIMRAPNFHGNGSLGSGPSTCSSTPTSDAVNNHYDGSGRVDCQWDPEGNKTTFSYSGSPFTASGGTTIVTDPAGNETEDGYQWGVRTFETKGYGSAVAATTYYTYDPTTLGLIATMDPDGNVTTYTVDSSGNPLTITDPLGRVTTTTYNSLNEVLTSEDPNGVTTTYTYDGNGNLLTVSTPLTGTAATATNCKSPSTAVAMAQVTCYTYGNGTYPGDVTQMTDPDGNITYYHYDSNGYVDEVKDPASHVTGTVRNNDGWVTATYTPKAGCTWNSSPPTGCSSTYETQDSYVVPGSSPSVTDEFGQVGTVTDPLSHTTEYTYDADGNQTSVEDGNGNTTTYQYNADDQVCWVLPDGTSGNACGSPPTNGRVTDYNSDGTVADQKDGKGNAIVSYGYNALDQVTSVTDALSNVTDYTYDGDGNMLTKLDPVSGATCSGTQVGCTTYTYDVDSELKTVSYSDSSSEDVSSITYDSDGQRTGMTDGTGSSSWSYDSLHRLTSYTNGNGATVTYGYTYGGGPSYDLKAQVRSIAYPNSVGTVDQSWNADGTLASVEDWNSNTTTFSYDANDNETGQTSRARPTSPTRLATTPRIR
jgi:YD repeat-containing protein